MRWTSELIVGFLVLVALALFAYFTVNIGDIRWTRRTQHWQVRFTDVSGLKEGDPVLVLGAKVGKVTRFDLQADHVVAHLELFQPVALHADYAISIRAPSILASMHVFVAPGSPDQPRHTDVADLRGRPAGGLFGDALGKLVDQLKAREGGLGRLLVVCE